jgi:hypothetical protein
MTLTSKNQVTIPAVYVKALLLGQNRVLRAELRGETIILTPHPILGDEMQRFWGKHNAKRPLTDVEIKQAVRSVVAKKAAKLK